MDRETKAVPNLGENKKITIKRVIEARILRMAQYVNERSGEMSEEERKAKILNEIKTRALELVPEASDRLEKIFLKMENGEFIDERVFAGTIAEELTNLMSDILTPSELEERMRKYQIETNAWQEISRGLSYGVYKDELWLHVNTMFLEGSLELKEVVEDGLRKLAKELNENPSLKNIKSINGKSWIAYRHQAFLRELGFEIVDLNKEKKEGTTRIDREELLRRYLNKQ
jgi:hypothetical protein